MSNAVISIPHSGTRAVMAALDMVGPQQMRGPRHAIAQPGRDVYGHCWHPMHPLSVADWQAICVGRTAYMPVRDPAELAFSWVQNRNWTLEWLEDALIAAVAVIKAIDPVRMDIRTLPVAGHSKKPGRDEETGKRLIELYPEYFSGIYLAKKSKVKARRKVVKEK